MKTFASELTANEIALDEWQENIREWESSRFNVSMKKALFLDHARSSVRVPLQMQNLDTFAAMAAVSLQFLQHDAQYQAGVTVTANNRRDPDDMEIDALTKKGKGYKGKGKGKNKTDGQKTSCFVCGRVGHMANYCFLKEANKGSGPNYKCKKDKGKGEGKGKNSLNEVTTPTESATTAQVGTSGTEISRTTRAPTLGTVPSP